VCLAPGPPHRRLSPRPPRWTTWWRRTAAFSGADALLRGALAVAAASGSYAVARRGSGTETAAAAELRETETLAVSREKRETETEAQLETTRDQLDVQSARSDALERENAALAAALEEATRDAEAARGAASRASSDAATARGDGAGREPGAPDRGAAC
jgi:septal ring factor EnvC (AmiA/AmiB activator)